MIISKSMGDDDINEAVDDLHVARGIGVSTAASLLVWLIIATAVASIFFL